MGYVDSAVGIAVGRIGKKFGVETGNASISRKYFEKLIKNPNLAFVKAVVIAPIVEEAIFRFLPNKIASGLKVDNTGAKLASSLLFSLAHNITEDEETGKIKFDTSMYHVSAALGGLKLWEEQERNGYFNAVVRHATHNTVFSAAIYGLNYMSKNMDPKLYQKVFNQIAPKK